MSARPPVFVGGTPAQQADTVIAHQNADQFAASCMGQLHGTPNDTNTLYDEWFGAFDQTRFDTVVKHFSDIYDVLQNEQVTYDLTGTGCDPSVYAYTYKGVRTVWLCSKYLSAPQTGTDSKSGTLIHELSHAVSSTDDIEYGEENCRNLATNDPSNAINNADSHEYFTEHLTGCFVASAVYWDAQHPDVAVLRAWRDNHLIPGANGRTAMRGLETAYKRVGPPLAEAVRRHPRLSCGLRRYLFAPFAAWLRRRNRSGN